MAKGKRKGGLSGLSKFVLESFKSTSSDTTSKENFSLAHNDELQENRPAKKRKGNHGIPVIDSTEPADLNWVDKYDATGLVPHCTHRSQVQAHLQKCMSPSVLFSLPHPIFRPPITL